MVIGFTSDELDLIYESVVEYSYSTETEEDMNIIRSIINKLYEASK